MNREKLKNERKQRRASRTRRNIHGTAQRPRLCVFRSNAHISVQLINDDSGVTVGYADDKGVSGNGVAKAMEVGKKIAAVAKEQNISTVIFDRGPYQYIGRVKALAEGARSEGLEF